MNRQASENSYDVIVIGSGMGGLATASLLAQVGKKRVLVLESHFKTGGFLHSFQRNGFVWDPGVHYVGDMEKGSLTRRCMDLVTGGRVDWHKMTSPFERFLFPEGSYAVPPCPKEYQKNLIEQFPKEERNIRQYFRDLKAVQNWSHRWFFSKQYPEPVASWIGIGRRLALINTKEYLDERFDDSMLKAVLVAQWPDYGTPPSESVFGIHAIVTSDFHHGGYYPIGGSQQIANGAVEVIEKHGGKCLVSHKVKEILVERNRVHGVKVVNRGKEKTFFARKIVSNAGVDTTFRHFLSPPTAKRERGLLSQNRDGTSALILFLGLKDDPRNHGFDDCNYWMYRNSQHVLAQAKDGEWPLINGAFLSFGSLRSPGQVPHTAQIVTLSRSSEWSQFQDSEWMKRGEAYESAKEKCADALLGFVEERFPGLSSIVDYRELSSPLTIKSFTGHPHGQIYGRECDGDRFEPGQWSIGTSVRGLYLTGTDIVVPGVNSALMIGVMTAAKLLGWTGMPRIMTRAFSG